jgi:hypothetical protein
MSSMSKKKSQGKYQFYRLFTFILLNCIRSVTRDALRVIDAFSEVNYVRDTEMNQL